MTKLFKKRIFGYSQKQVDHYIKVLQTDHQNKLNDLDSAVAKLKAEHGQLQEKLAMQHLSPALPSLSILEMAREKAVAAGQVLIDNAQEKGCSIVLKGQAKVKAICTSEIETHEECLRKKLLSILDSTHLELMKERGELLQGQLKPSDLVLESVPPEDIRAGVETEDQEMINDSAEHIQEQPKPSDLVDIKIARTEGAVGAGALGEIVVGKVPVRLKKVVIKKKYFYPYSINKKKIVKVFPAAEPETVPYNINNIADSVPGNIDLNHPELVPAAGEVSRNREFPFTVTAFVIMVLVVALILSEVRAGMEVLSPLALIALLIGKEFVSTASKSSDCAGKKAHLRSLRLVLNVAMVPLLIVFGLILKARIIESLNR
jgi:hypothetical protein